MATLNDISATGGVAEKPHYWLFNRPVDLAVFVGSAVVSLGAIWVGHLAGVLHEDTPEWAWVPFILMIDVAHVYATGFRVYFDRQELARRPILYATVPIICFLGGLVLIQSGQARFWQILAYLAVFHFVRQQFGWVTLYRAKLREPGGWEKALDTTAIYAATIYPLIYWHANLPRNFFWFTPADFGTLPRQVVIVSTPIYWTIMVAYAFKAIRCWVIGRPNPGKDLVVATTAVCWYVGIVVFNSDYAFTVTNVVIHGVPYVALVYFYYNRRRAAQRSTDERPAKGRWSTLVFIISTIWALAYFEELIWDRAIYQERDWLFGSAVDVGGWSRILIPLLAVPQLTHYVLDGFIWRRKGNPDLKKFI